jgi:hypothetical protein
MPNVDKSLDELRREDLVPFQRAIDEGVDMMMVSHVAFPMGREKLTPASFDRRIMQDMLRAEMGFDGAVITDSLEMAGARWGRFGESGGGFERPLLAGADLLLHTKPVPEAVDIDGGSERVMSLNVMETVIKTLEKVVDQGRIDQKVAEAAESNETLKNLLSILDESFDRVVRLRQKLSHMAKPVKPAARTGKVIQFDAYPSVPGVYKTVAEESIAVWGDAAALRELSGESRCVVVPFESPAAGQSLKKQDIEGFTDVLCRHFPSWRRTGTVSGFAVGDDGEVYPDIRDLPPVIDATRFTGQERMGFHLTSDEELVLVFSCRGESPVEFIDSLGSFAGRFEPAAVLVLGWPILDWIPESTPALLCFGASTQVASAAASILAGEAAARGRIDRLWPR